MPPSTGQHADIAEFLNDKFRAHIKQLGLLLSKQGAFAVQLPPTEGGILAPDVCVVTAEQWQQLRDRSTAIALDDPPPKLVVEVVSTN